MSGKTIILAVSVFALTIALHSACFGADLPKLSIDLTKMLNEQLNEHMAAKFETHATPITTAKPIRFGDRHGLYPSYPFITGYYHHCGIVALEWFKFRSLSTGDITIAFLDCTSIKLFILETSAPVQPKWAGVLMDDIIDDYLILNKTETSEGYAIRIMQRLMNDACEPNAYEIFDFGTSTSIEEEAKRYKDSNKFIPSLTIEIEGKHRLRIEINKEKQIGFIQNSEGWGFFTIDKLTAEALLKFATNICELENANSH